MYDNQNEVDAVAKRLQEVDPSLRIRAYSLSGNKVVSVEVALLERGNKHIINKLLEMGFEKAWREKVADIYTSYSGYSFRVCMRMAI